MKNNLSFRFYSTCTLVFWLPNFDKFDKFSFTTVHERGSLWHSTVKELIYKNAFLLLLSHEIALKRVCWIIYKDERGQNV